MSSSILQCNKINENESILEPKSDNNTKLVHYNLKKYISFHEYEITIILHCYLILALILTCFH